MESNVWIQREKHYAYSSTQFQRRTNAVPTPESRQREVQFDIPTNSAPQPEPPDKDTTQGSTVEPEGAGEGLRRSTRQSIPVIGNRLVDAMCIEILEMTTDAEGAEIQTEGAPVPGELFAYSSLFPIDDDIDEDPILTYAASADPDTLYYHEAMREPDADQLGQRKLLAQEKIRDTEGCKDSTWSLGNETEEEGTYWRGIQAQGTAEPRRKQASAWS